MYGLIVWVSTSVGNLNMVYYRYVSRSYMLKSGTQKHPSFGWKYEKHLSSMHAERCCTIAFFLQRQVLLLLVSKLCACQEMKLFPFFDDCFSWSVYFNLLGIGKLSEKIGCQNAKSKGSRYCSQYCTFIKKALDLLLTTMKVKQVRAFHAPLKRDDTNVKTTKQQVLNKCHVKVHIYATSHHLCQRVPH